MAFMHEKTFDIVVEKSIKNPDDYFWVDDLIALPVQILNRKGYITEACCAGHPFDWLQENGKYADESEQVNAEILALRKTYKSFTGYIAFQKGISLPTLPPCILRLSGEDYIIIYGKESVDYIYEDNPPVTIGSITLWDTKISDNDIYKFMRRQIETMEQLYEWALNLPEYKLYVE